MPRQKPEIHIDDEDIDLDKEVVIVNGQRLTEEMAAQIADEAERTSRERSIEHLTNPEKRA